MATKKLLAAILAMVCTSEVHAADQREVQGLLDKYRSVRPKQPDLAIYELDWASTLAVAKEKAGKEHRPIFLVVVTNSFGNVCSGHC